MDEKTRQKIIDYIMSRLYLIPKHVEKYPAFVRSGISSLLDDDLLVVKASIAVIEETIRKATNQEIENVKAFDRKHKHARR